MYNLSNTEGTPESTITTTR